MVVVVVVVALGGGGGDGGIDVGAVDTSHQVPRDSANRTKNRTRSLNNHGKFF